MKAGLCLYNDFAASKVSERVSRVAVGVKVVSAADGGDMVRHCQRSVDENAKVASSVGCTLTEIHTAGRCELPKDGGRVLAKSSNEQWDRNSITE